MLPQHATFSNPGQLRVFRIQTSQDLFHSIMDGNLFKSSRYPVLIHIIDGDTKRSMYR